MGGGEAGYAAKWGQRKGMGEGDRGTNGDSSDIRVIADFGKSIIGRMGEKPD